MLLTLLIGFVPWNLLTNSSGVATVKSFSWKRWLWMTVPWDIDGLHKNNLIKHNTFYHIDYKIRTKFKTSYILLKDMYFFVCLYFYKLSL